MKKNIQECAEYQEALEAFQRLQREQVNSREREIELQTEVTLPANRNKSALVAELADIERRAPALAEQLDEARGRLDAVRGRLSPEFCAPARLACITEVRSILSALKTISECNRKILSIREQAEAEGLSTASLPPAVFMLGGFWDDPNGGKVVSYQRHVAECFPELKSEAQ